MIVIIVAFVITGKKSYFKKYNEYANALYVTIADDGSCILIDTNPFDYDCGTYEFYIYYVENYVSCAKLIKKVNSDLGFSDSLYTKMQNTSALKGVQTESNGHFTVSWNYHPDNGLEVFYEVK